MTEQELSKYAGKKTFGKNNEILTNGIVVGYDPDDNEQCLVARFENGDVSGAGWSKTPRKIKFFTKEEEEIYNTGKGCYLFAKIDNVMMEEEKELDLTEILKNCEGVELWSDICGKCIFTKSDDNEICVKEIGYGRYSLSFLNNGKYDDYPNGKCLLWPSETCRDWSTFKKPLKADDWVVACDGEGCGHINKYCNINRTWKYVIPFEKYNPTLTDEELKKLSIV